jgi:hypothetical protein
MSKSKMREMAISKEGIRDTIPKDVPDISSPVNLQTVDETSRPNSKGG